MTIITMILVVGLFAFCWGCARTCKQAKECQEEQRRFKQMMKQYEIDAKRKYGINESSL